MPSVLVVCYDTSSGKFLVKSAGTSQIADLAITSAKIGLLAVGTPHIADGAVTSAKIASGYLTPLADGEVTSAKIASGAVGDAHIYPGAIISAKIAADAIGGGHILDGSLTYAELADATLVSAKYGANQIGTPHILNQGILSASIGLGVIGNGHLADYGVTSGKYASGSIFEEALASGISIDIAELEQEPTFKAASIISAYQAIQFTPAASGGRHFDFAQAANVSSMPAIGVTVAAVASGAIGTFQHKGRLTCAAWDFSGQTGQLLFVGTSSQITLTAPSASGQCSQRIGKVAGPTTAFLNPDMSFVQLAE